VHIHSETVFCLPLVYARELRDWNASVLLVGACSECEDMIRRLLCTNPHRRITVPEIVSHRWMRMAGDDSEFDRLMALSVNPSDEDSEPNEVVLEHMSRLGLDRDQVLAVFIHAAVIFTRGLYCMWNYN